MLWKDACACSHYQRGTLRVQVRKTTQELPGGMSGRGQLSSMAGSYGERLESFEKSCVVWPMVLGWIGKGTLEKDRDSYL